MADMTDSAFCRTVRAISPAADGLIVFREMVSSEAVVRGNDKTLDMTDIHEDERPLVQQIFGSDPATMAESARIIEEQHHPEGFDINMGCPVYKIVHNFNGAALMKEPELASKIVKAMKAVITVPLSVKIRLGWSDPTECLEFIKVLEQSGVELVTIHGRTKTQGYSGKADWQMVGRAKQQVSIPVLCNGDIHKPELVREALDVSKADGVLIARGALGNPWFFSHIASSSPLLFALPSSPRRGWGWCDGVVGTPVSTEERLRIIRLHAKLHTEQYGGESMRTFRKHLTWYFKGLPGAKTLRELLPTINNQSDLESVLLRL